MGCAHGAFCRTLDPKGSRLQPHYHSKNKKDALQRLFVFRAGKGTRTLDPDLGKVVLYQLSYSREVRPIIEYYFRLVKGLCKEKIKISCFFPLNSKNPSFLLM